MTLNSGSILITAKQWPAVVMMVWTGVSCILFCDCQIYQIDVF